MTEIRPLGKVLGVTDCDTAEQVGSENIQIRLSGQGEQEMANSVEIHQETTRGGRSFWVANAIGTPVSALTAIPTTAACISIYNNEPDGGRSYVINYVWAYNVAVSSLTIFHAGIIGCLGQVRDAIPTAGAPVIKQANSGGKLDTRCRPVIAAMGAGAGLATNWFPIGDTWHNRVVTLTGHGKYVPIDGRIICPPGRYFGVHVLASITTNTYIMGIGWTEKQLVLG